MAEIPGFVPEEAMVMPASQPPERLSPFETKEAEETAERYLDFFNLTWEDLQGKQILDVGAGDADFARVAKQHGISVVSVDKHPELNYPEGTVPTDVPFIVADAAKIPLPDASFDIIVCLASRIGGEETVEDFLADYTEAMRLLKPGGELRYGPAMMNPAILGPYDESRGVDFAALPLEEKYRRVFAEIDTYLRTINPTFERLPMRGQRQEPTFNYYERVVKPADSNEEKQI